MVQGCKGTLASVQREEAEASVSFEEIEEAFQILGKGELSALFQYPTGDEHLFDRWTFSVY
jgi:hypothetical protein